MTKQLILAIAVAALCAFDRPASAQVACNTLSNPIYIQAGDTQVNLLKNLARKMRDNTAMPATLVFTTSGSCANIDLMYNHNPATGIAGTMSYVPSIAEDPTWSPATSPLLTCTPPASTFPDIGNSALFNEACPQGVGGPPATVHNTRGPVQGYVLAVPEASNEHAITFEEAYFVFGFGNAGMIMPWMDETQMFIRTTTKSTLVAWAAQLAIPPARMKGKAEAASSMVVTDLQTTAAPQKAIGILGMEVYDALRSTLNVLAYRAKDQYAAYYPDSTASSFDKQNIRDGHYVPWSPTIWMDFVTGTTPTNPLARYIIDLIAGHVVTPAPNFIITDIVAGVGAVPDCAMGVTRDVEQGPLRLYTPTTSCTCRFEYVATGTTSCNHCDASTPCATGVCRDSYCEAR
jgi:hypothetical protein